MGIIEDAGRKTLGEIIITLTFFLVLPITGLALILGHSVIGILGLVFCIVLLHLGTDLKKRK
ncbi:hypothetical protein [Methanococcus maripaludis]|uniref:Uncharacterized protein n=2 Tax=Methanococcus maripaludis TaxID=39152 RepID=A0A7J9PGK8_METMI|nr:hypothetical protein [Methanococcus maripaludis]MBA2861886.1 hypothetical protein [Methanococcus maripaludis]